VATQLDTGDNTPEGIFGSTLPLGSIIYAFVDGSYAGNSATYENVFMVGDQWSQSLDLGQGVSYWVQSSVPVVNIISGEVDLSDAVTNSIVPGLQLISYPYPVQRNLSQLNITPSLGDIVYKYVNGSYSGNSATYENVFMVGDQWSQDLSLGVGEGFWYQSVSATTNAWIETRPFTP
jgi:hypothetical protein